MGQELQVPQAFQGRGMSQAFAQGGLNAQDDNLAAGIGQSYGVVGYKGKVWSGRYRGERKPFLRPDDGTPTSYLDVIILGQAQTKSKSYYKQYDVNQSEGERPICSSLDGILPDLDVATKQCDTCALCPRNAWKMQPNGKKGRECTDYKRLAVLVLPTQTKPTFGQAIMEPMFLRVPPDSLNSLAIMGETMSNQGFHYASFITRITFDPQKAHPCMVFRPLQPLTDAEAPVILELTRDPLVGRITLGDSAGAIREAGVQAVAQSLPAAGSATGLVAAALNPGASIPQSPAPATQPQQQPAPTPPSPPTSTGLAGAAVAAATGTQQQNGAHSLSGITTAAQLVTVAAPPLAASSETSTGLVAAASGGANTVSAGLVPSSQATVNGFATGAAVTSVVDTGPAEASDDELDARIAALIAPK